MHRFVHTVPFLIFLVSLGVYRYTTRIKAHERTLTPLGGGGRSALAANHLRRKRSPPIHDHALGRQKPALVPVDERDLLGEVPRAPEVAERQWLTRTNRPKRQCWQR